MGTPKRCPQLTQFVKFSVKLNELNWCSPQLEQPPTSRPQIRMVANKGGDEWLKKSSFNPNNCSFNIWAQLSRVFSHPCNPVILATTQTTGEAPHQRPGTPSLNYCSCSPTVVAPDLFPSSLLSGPSGLIILLKLNQFPSSNQTENYIFKHNIF